MMGHSLEGDIEEFLGSSLRTPSDASLLLYKLGDIATVRIFGQRGCLSPRSAFVALSWMVDMKYQYISLLRRRRELLLHTDP